MSVLLIGNSAEIVNMKTFFDDFCHYLPLLSVLMFHSVLLYIMVLIPYIIL